MNKNNAISMAQNFFVPMYRDQSGIGKFLSIFIRFWWVGFGTLTSLIYTIPNFIILILLIILPLLPAVEIILFLFVQLKK